MVFREMKAKINLKWYQLGQKALASCVHTVTIWKSLFPNVLKYFIFTNIFFADDVSNLN